MQGLVLFIANSSQKSEKLHKNHFFRVKNLHNSNYFYIFAANFDFFERQYYTYYVFYIRQNA